MPSAELKPAVPAIKQRQTHALDRRATWFGYSVLQSYITVNGTVMVY